MPLGPVAAGALGGTPAAFSRHEHHLKDSNDDFHLEIIETGPVQFAHAGEERIYDSGSACFIDQARPMRGFGPRYGSVRNITVPAAVLKTLVAHPEDLAGHAVHPGPALRLLDGYPRSLTSLEHPPLPELAPIIGVLVLDLVSAPPRPPASSHEGAANRGLRAP